MNDILKFYPFDEELPETNVAHWKKESEGVYTMYYDKLDLKEGERFKLNLPVDFNEKMQ